MPGLQPTGRVHVAERQHPRTGLLEVPLNGEGAEVLVHDVEGARQGQATRGEAPKVKVLLVVEVAEVALVRRQVHNVEVGAQALAHLPGRHPCNHEEHQNGGKGDGGVTGQESDHCHKASLQERGALRAFLGHARGPGPDAEARIQPWRVRTGAPGIKGQESAEGGAVEEPDVEARAGRICTEPLDRGEDARCAQQEGRDGGHLRQRYRDSDALHGLLNAVWDADGRVQGIEGTRDDEGVIDANADQDEGENLLKHREGNPKEHAGAVSRNAPKDHQVELDQSQ